MTDSSRRMPLWLWAAALAPRLALFALALLDPRRCLRGDSRGYLALAHNLIARGVFSSDAGPPFSPATFRSPGYPLFLACFVPVFKDPVLPAVLAQCLLGAATVWLVWRWIKDAGNEPGAIAGALVLAFDPVLVFHTPLLLSESFHVFLLTLAVYCTTKSSALPERRGAALSGFLWSLAAMVKPISLYLPIPLSLIWKKDKRAVLIFLLSAYLLPAAWTLRNRRETGYTVFSSVGGISLLRYPASGVESLRTGKPLGKIDAELREWVDREHPEGYRSDAERADAYARAAVPIIKAHPLLLGEYWAWGMVKVLAGTGLEMLIEWLGSTETSELEFHAKATGRGTRNLLRRHAWLIPIQGVYMIALAALYLLSLIGLKNLWQKGETRRALVLAGCAAYFLMLAGSQGYYRYRIPMMPFLAASAAASLRRKS